MNANFRNFLPNTKVKTMYAIAVDDKHLWYKCPFTKSNIIHQHGSNGNLLNREEYRSGHNNDAAECRCGNIKIVVCNQTERITMRPRKTSYVKVLKSKKKMNAIHQKQIEKDFWLNPPSPQIL